MLRAFLGNSIYVVYNIISTVVLFPGKSYF